MNHNHSSHNNLWFWPHRLNNTLQISVIFANYWLIAILIYLVFVLSENLSILTQKLEVYLDRLLLHWNEKKLKICVPSPITHLWSALRDWWNYYKSFEGAVAEFSHLQSCNFWTLWHYYFPHTLNHAAYKITNLQIFWGGLTSFCQQNLHMPAADSSALASRKFILKWCFCLPLHTCFTWFCLPAEAASCE